MAKIQMNRAGAGLCWRGEEDGSVALPRRIALDGLVAAAVYFLILSYIWWLRFRVPASWIAIYALVVWSHIRRREGLEDLGLRSAGFRESLRKFGPWLLLVAVLLLGGGALLHSFRRISWWAGAGSLVFSCGWGLFQQYLLNGFFLNRVRSPLLAALLFAGVHAPNWFLEIVTLGGGWLAACAFRRFRNLPFLGLAHGFTSFLIYLVVPESISHHMYVGPKYWII